MKKLLLVVIAVIVAAILFFGYSLGSIVKEAVETSAPKIIGAKVKVEKVDVSLISGSASISGLTVYNPKGFNSAYAVKLKQANLELELASLLSDLIVIKSINITQPDIIYEVSAKGANFDVLQKNAKKSKPTQASKNQDNIDVSNSHSKKVVIDHLYITEGKVAGSLSDAKLSMNLPNIHLKDIGRNGQGGVSFEEASLIVLSAINKNFAKIDARNAVKQLIKDNKNLKKIEDKINDNMKGVKGKLESLF